MRDERLAHEQELQKQKRGHKPGTKLKWHPALVTFVLLGAGLLFVLALELFTPKNKSQAPQVTEARSSDPALEAKVTEIASKFICSCGKCGEQSLDACACNTAIEQRQFIRNYLQYGQSPEQVIAAVNSTFGWMKTELAGQFAGSASKAGGPKRPLAPTEPNNNLLQSGTKLSPASKVATAAERIEILSHFRCPCGQCGTQELKDCNCSHPRGAREVKAFVDSKLAKGKYTVAGVMDEVEMKYGGRRF